MEELERDSAEASAEHMESVIKDLESQIAEAESAGDEETVGHLNQLIAIDQEKLRTDEVKKHLASTMETAKEFFSEDKLIDMQSKMDALNEKTKILSDMALCSIGLNSARMQDNQDAYNHNLELIKEQKEALYQLSQETGLLSHVYTDGII